MSARLTVLSREYCHLCQQMIAQLEDLRGRHGFEVEVVDVDQDSALEERWGDKVPVLLDGEHEICHYFLDAGALEARLARIA